MKYLIFILSLSIFLNAQDTIKNINNMSVQDLVKFISTTAGKKLPKRLDDITITRTTSYENKTYVLKKYLIPKDEKTKKKFKNYLVPAIYEQQKFYDFVRENELKNICNSTLLRILLKKMVR